MGISVTSSTGFTATQEQAQAYLQTHGNQATLEMAKANGYSNEQIAALIGVQKSAVDRYEASAVGTTRMTTPSGHQVTADEVANYRTAYGDQATFAKGKALGMSNADMAAMLGISTAEVDHFENTLRDSAEKPSDAVYTPDLYYASSEQQFWAQALWLAPRNTEISNEEVSTRTHQLLAELTALRMPPRQSGRRTRQ